MGAHDPMQGGRQGEGEKKVVADKYMSRLNGLYIMLSTVFEY
jgi:hypothetical protein